MSQQMITVTSTNKNIQKLPSVQLPLEALKEEIFQQFTKQSGTTFLLYGNDSVFGYAHRIAAEAIARGRTLAVVDASNYFDVHSLARYARLRKIDPEEFLNHIFISRGFTCYQVEQTITVKLPELQKKLPTQLVLILGLLDTFYDENVNIQEAKSIVQKVISSLDKLKGAGISFLVVCQERNIFPPVRNQIFAMVRQSMDYVAKLQGTETEKARCIPESRHTNHNIYKIHG
ncbi:MAG TPA: hypothetical protein PK595_00120 [Bacteroidota bacterium]|jgi:hypothetical protein|nr:hypothetical protein [Bacteroidota bacterium]